MNREPIGHAGDQLKLLAANQVRRPIDGEGGTPQVHGIVQLQLHIVPIHPVDRCIDLQSVVEQFALEANFVVDEVVR